MTRNYSHNEIDLLTYNLLWMTANQTESYYPILRIPIQNMAKTRDSFKDYQTNLYNILQVPELAEAPDDKAIEYELINNLTKSGEYIDRILFWLQSINDRNSSKSAINNWVLYFAHTIRKLYRGSTNSKIQSLIQTYNVEVNKPYWSVDEKIDTDEKFWMASPQNRSSYDEMLWETYYEEVWSAPVILFSNYINNIFLRRWWRKNCDILNASEKELMYEDFVTYCQECETQNPGMINWEELKPIDEAFNTNDIPDFELYAAPAQ